MNDLKCILQLMTNIEYGAVKLNSIIKTAENLNESIYNIIKNEKLDIDLDEEYIDYLIEHLYHNDIKILECNSEYYPINFKKDLIRQYPPIIFVWGNLNLLNSKCFSVIGSRNNTQYGSDFTIKITDFLINNNQAICTGGAKGIDYIALLNTLEKNGKLIIIPSDSIDNFLNRNRYIYDFNLDNVLIISEKLPLIEWNRIYALARNRLIASFAEKTVVIESATKSGTLSTAFWCNKIRKPLFCIKHDLINYNGNDFLIKNKNAIYILEEDIPNNLEKILLNRKRETNNSYFNEFI